MKTHGQLNGVRLQRVHRAARRHGHHSQSGPGCVFAQALEQSGENQQLRIVPGLQRKAALGSARLEALARDDTLERKHCLPRNLRDLLRAGRGHHFMTASNQELIVQRLSELRKLTAHRRLADPQRLGRLGDALMRHQRIERREVAQVQALPIHIPNMAYADLKVAERTRGLHPERMEAQSLELFIHPGSPNARRARLAARLAANPVTETLVDVAKGENRTRSYLALNPMGKVPTLRLPDGTALWESRAIAARLAQGTSALPDSQRAQIDRWQFFDACHFSEPLGTLVFQRMFSATEDPQKVQVALQAYQQNAAVVEAHLNNSAYLTGDTPTIADTCLLASLTYAEATQLPLDQTPRLRDWRAGLEARPELGATRPPAP